MTNSPPGLNRMRTVVDGNNNNKRRIMRFLERRNTVVPYSNNTHSKPRTNNSGLMRFLERRNTVVPYSYNIYSNPRNTVIGPMLQRRPTVVMEMGGKRKTRRNKKVRKTRRSHKK